MKITVELPDELVRALKVRAAQEGRRLKDVMAETVRRGLAEPPARKQARSHRVRLPLVECAHPDAAHQAIRRSELRFRTAGAWEASDLVSRERERPVGPT